jgi:hypothetical protein
VSVIVDSTLEVFLYTCDECDLRELGLGASVSLRGVSRTVGRNGRRR